MMRVDRFLFFIRLIKSRTQAQGLVEDGKVRIDGRRAAKPSEEVRPGTIIALPLHREVRILRVLTLSTRRGHRRKRAPAMKSFLQTSRR